MVRGLNGNTYTFNSFDHIQSLEQVHKWVLNEKMLEAFFHKD